MTTFNERDLLCVNTIRGLSLDGVEKAKSGHAGLPLGAAPMAHVLWHRHLKFDPAAPNWIDRDRFVLSAGHGSMLLYSLLHLTGFDLPLKELMAFRQLDSKTPGHPENTHTPGVEMATGPLGQGVAHTVGMAMAEAHLAAEFPGEINHFTYAICSDGDLMEGVANEAASLAGHLRLGKLIWLYDDNGITIDGRTDLTFTEDVEKRFQAMGWHTQRIDGMDMNAVDAAITEAKAHLDQPSLILAKTVIGYGSPKLAGTNKAHSNPFGTEELKATKIALGISEEPFHVPAKVADHYALAADRGKAAHAEWAANASDSLRALAEGKLGADWIGALPAGDDKVATRKASERVIQAIAPHLKGLVGGSADLAESNLTHQKGFAAFGPGSFGGRNVNFGVREHAMIAAVNGMTLHGGVKAYGASFLIFSDYARPALRLAALMQCPSIYVFTHDSVGVGEDGPTHEPVEHLMSLRAIPNFNVFRPADANETAAGWKVALESRNTPTLLALTRQAVPAISPANVANHPAERGAYVLADAEDGAPDVILIATGSEVQLCLSAREELKADGIQARVVSMPSWFLFDNQTEEYQDEVLLPEVPRVSIEAGSTLGWPRFADICLGIDRFGLSAPGDVVMRELGITSESVVEAVHELLAEDA
ncbi:MAG: transketolase [Fimbriimonadaceae bacterium]|nr:transketolase [Fimbriimonadaceae bacterium]